MDKRSKRVGVSSDYVLTTIAETIVRCRQRVRPMTYKNGEPVLIEDENGLLVPGYTFDAGSVLRGAELLGRHLKMFTDKVEHGGTGGGSLEMITRIELVAAVSGSNITLGEAAV